ncbi:MAG: hypothetical protein AAGA85_21900 [Bacteroidota bacterium]
MAHDMKELLEKYWRGETSLEEEREIKQHFAEHPSLAPEGRYFQALSDQKKQTADRVWKRPSSVARWSVAASVAVGVMVAFLVMKDAENKQPFEVEDPQAALEITRNALMMVSSNLNEGKAYSSGLDKLNDGKAYSMSLDKINKAQKALADQ